MRARLRRVRKRLGCRCGLRRAGAAERERAPWTRPAQAVPLDTPPSFGSRGQEEEGAGQRVFGIALGYEDLNVMIR
jgi:hypothetical protein